MYVYYGDDKFTEPQVKRIKQLQAWIDESSKAKKIEFENVTYYRDNSFNFYCSLSKILSAQVKRGMVLFI